MAAITWLFINHEGSAEWRLEASESAFVEDMVRHAMEHFQVTDAGEYHFQYENAQGEWELADDEQQLGDLHQAAGIMRLRLVSAEEL